ncbi:ParB/RepB/Spo0J family partition protein, partial [Qipengyuania spongiae]
PAIVRRVEGDPQHHYEVVAGTRRHWAISWLRTHSYPDMRFLAQVHELDDEAAFRLADIENRARKDVSDLERARNYAAALSAHYGGHQTRMAERLKLSKGWLSKMLKVAAIPDAVIAAFPSPADVALKPAYPLAQALDDPRRAAKIHTLAGHLAEKQVALRVQGAAPIAAATVLSDLLAAGQNDNASQNIMIEGAHGRPAVTLRKATRQGVTIHLHAGHGLDRADLLERVATLLDTLDNDERALVR